MSLWDSENGQNLLTKKASEKENKKFKNPAEVIIESELSPL